MQRYFVPESAWNGNIVTIKDDDAHHIHRVMRFKEGDQVICNHPDGSAAICNLIAVGSDEVRLEVEDWLNESVELPIEVTIAQGLPKGDKLDLILQKGTELGASSFIPFQAERSVVVWDNKKIEKKMKRFSKIVKEASEQSHRNKVPEIKSPMTMSALLKESQKYDVKIFAYEEEAKIVDFQSFGTLLNKLKKDQSLFVCIGPEGGFSPKEAETLRDNNFYPVRLGPRILRTETAALYALASISYHFEELRCN
ncbi:16S rRNA (uracil(1498)-N(3))-methyltransferase [Virgibacillus profundi]|uniref:Ribosomal RNA small subunit methyltransferase E n=1 Tax=Virgibacillus profundi TaxID=2024555 RepID=A0A2A2ICC6_9BACI|nr:16S rRNA (uracil(1498)-N(3))-methyltransferase [Virgibacillus profundi]PAV29018.1 16S rRNA (uracil(1498)-N(3))-methyltransferase [Virgibacillus profundi]PXY53187.1 16S rRNA (uracil(1498)-N(3))-methyltransferase [Virgibacillus profundi]